MFLSLVLFLSALPIGFGMTPSATASSSGSPVNPEASPEATRLLNYLYSLSGKGILAGQHDYLESPEIGRAHV